MYINNFSNSKLKILKVENACGCTFGLTTDSLIKPMDSTLLTVKYMPSYNNDTGLVVKHMTVRTDGHPPFINLVIKAEVEQ